ncbi:MAG: ABC transporter permease [Dehalococcoidales bacterium]|jgi:peptide/nickel transport system permease protein
MTTKNSSAAPAKRVEDKRPGFFMDLLRRLILEKPLGTFGLGVIIIFFAAGIFSKFIMPFGYQQIHLLERLQGPSAKYLLGTDELGRDELSRLIYGARISMEVGLGATFLNVLVSILIGATSGFLGGKTDMIVQRFVDVWMSIPGFVILLTVMTILPRNLIVMILVLGITGGIGGARLVRSAVIAIKSNIYISASDAIGCSPMRILLVHIIPNIMPTLIIMFTLGIGGNILAEAGLSFLGFGLPPGIPSWGVLINSSQAYLQTDPQLALWPGLALSLSVYGINMFGDSIRDLLDPRLRGGVGRYSLSDKKLNQLKQSLAGKVVKTN